MLLPVHYNHCSREKVCECNDSCPLCKAGHTKKEKIAVFDNGKYIIMDKKKAIRHGIIGASEKEL